MNTLRNELRRSYSQIPNELITDLSISAGALRVLLYLFTKPDDWSVYNADICKNLNIHSETLSKYWKELLASKWLQRTEKRDKGLFVGYEYSIGEFDHTDNLPIRENTDTVKNGNGKNPDVTNNNFIPTIKDTNTKYKDIVEQIISYLNQKTGANYKTTTKSTVSHIKARLKEGFTLDDFYTVIDKKVLLWGKDIKMQAYLRPETLFSPKFESYLNEVVSQGKILQAQGVLSDAGAKTMEVAQEWIND